MNVLTPDKPEFYDRPSAELKDQLPTRLMLTPAHNLAIHKARGFNGLTKQSMIDAFNTRAGSWKPGEICVTAWHGFPQLNVMGRDAGTDASRAQLTWLQEFQNPDGKPLNTNQVAKQVAEELGDKISGRSAHDWVWNNLHGQSIYDTASMFQITANPTHPFDADRITSTNGVGTADTNDAGEAFAAHSAAENLTLQEEAAKVVRTAVDKLRDRLIDRMSGNADPSSDELLAFALSPEQMPWVIKQSPALRRVMEIAADRKL